MRLIARLDVKNEHVIKGIHLEGLRKVGKPNEMALEYYESGVDEIVFMDAVASLYDRNNLFHIIEAACREVFVPIAIGGGIRSVEDVSRALDAGADKVVINTGAIRNLNLIEKVASVFGSQCLVGSIEAKATGSGWEAYVDNGREPTNLDAVEWSKSLSNAGCGEIMITSIDKEGTMRGFEDELVRQISNCVSNPIIVSGGYGKPSHLKTLVSTTVPSAIAFASVLHYKKAKISELRRELELTGI